MKAVIYARVSSKEQEQEGYSIPSQIKLLNEYALKNNYKVIKKFVDVETAKQAGRENFNFMLQYLQKNSYIKTIICEKTDRLSRNLRDVATLYDLMNSHNLNIALVKENTILNKDSKSQEKFMFDIRVIMAKNYIDNLSEETKKGMIEKAEQGLYPASAPLGYKNCETKNHGKVIKHLDIDEQRAPLIEELFIYYATGDFSIESLAKQIYTEGLRSKHGVKVVKSAVHKILNNPIYYGFFNWGGKLYKGSHPPIISKELFDAVQEAFKTQNKPKYIKKRFAYAGLMVCGNCGCAITAEIQKGKYIYYHCTGFKGKCGNQFVREEKISEQFAEIIKKIYIDDKTLELVKDTLTDSHQDEIEFHGKQIHILNAEKKKLENRLHQIYLDKIDGKISERFYDEHTDKWREEINQLQETTSRHENSDANYLTQGINILELCNKAYQLYLEKEPLKRAILLRYILSNSTLTDGSICPTYRKPFNLFAEGLYRSNWGG